jgi:hypothetical protein
MQGCAAIVSPHAGHGTITGEVKVISRPAVASAEPTNEDSPAAALKMLPHLALPARLIHPADDDPPAVAAPAFGDLDFQGRSHSDCLASKLGPSRQDQLFPPFPQ